MLIVQNLSAWAAGSRWLCAARFCGWGSLFRVRLLRARSLFGSWCGCSLSRHSSAPPFICFSTTASTPHARWPVTSADEVAANETRREGIVRGGVYTALTAAFLGAAVGEEIIFRSFVLAEQRRASSTWISVSVVAALTLIMFAVSHLAYGTGNVVTGLVLGVVCTAIALYTRSLW